MRNCYYPHFTDEPEAYSAQGHTVRSASFLMLLSTSRLLATERAPNERKTIAGNCWHDELNNLELDLPQGTPKAWEEQLKRNEQYLNSLYFQQRGSFPPLQLLWPESWEQPLLLLSTTATCCGGNDAEKNITGSFPWNWGEGRKKRRGIPIGEENL